MNKISLVSLLLFLALSLLFLIPRTLTIDHSHPAITIEPYGDYMYGGKSRILTHRDSLSCDIEYHVSSHYKYPYVGIGFFILDKEMMIDLSTYQKVTIEIDPEVSDIFNCLLTFHTPGFTDFLDANTHRGVLTSILVEENRNRYSFNLKDLRTPQWWYSANKISEDELPPLNYREFTGISFSNHPALKHNNNYQLCVKKVVFSKRNYGASTLFIILFTLNGLWILWKREIKKKKVFVPYTPVTLTGENSSEEELILSYIGDNYSRSRLSLEELTQQTGVSAKRVRSILREKYDVSFKQYLNHIRISEAIRLMNETKNPIGEIALSVGYKHVSTFNSIFKSLHGTSPSQFKHK